MTTPDLQNLHNYLSGVSFLSVVATTEDDFYKTVQFYTDLGFAEIFVYDRTDPSNVKEHDHCRTSEKETWLLSQGESSAESNVILKIRWVTDAVQWQDGEGARIRRTSFKQEREMKIERRNSLVQSPTGGRSAPDWRGSNQSIVFYTQYLGHVIQLLEEKGYSYQALPNSQNPFEVYTHDPLSTLIGFTTKHNPFTRIIKKFDMPTTNGQKKVQPKRDATDGPRKRIAVMTSGGDSPGMNGAVRAVVRMAIARGCDAFCIHEGYQGLVDGGGLIKQYFWDDVRGWLSDGGTNIGTARCVAFRERSGRLQAAKNLIHNGIDGLIVCGGDGSLTGADLFRSEWPDLIDELVSTNQISKEAAEPHRHLNIVGLVGSIDNDMSTTDATIGAYSSLTRICQAVDYIDATAMSHQRAFVVEVMGRHCGWLALMAGISTGSDFVFMPEKPPNEGWEDDMCRIVNKHRSLGKRKTIVIVAEGAIDRQLKPITSAFVKTVLEQRLGLDTRITTLGHVQRGGPACAYDRMLATLQGAEAVDAILESTPDTPSPMIGITENKIVRCDLMKAVQLTTSVATAIAEKNFQQAMKLRDAEFEEYYKCYELTTHTEKENLKFPKGKQMRIAIIHVGAPAGGMNAATRAAVTYCLSRGHTPIAIYNGFPGFCRHDSARELNWIQVEGWAIRGGSEIGVNRTQPSEDIAMTAYLFHKYEFDGLFIIGGFEAFSALLELKKARSAYVSFRIPMVHLPATISNNVPGTEFSIGSDTCLNALIEYCDAIRQSASASRRRVFVVEVQGGRCGYVATMAGLSVGALAVYTPEEGITLKRLGKDIDFLRENFANDQGMNRNGKLVLVNEKASKTYTTESIAGMIREEAKGRFEARTSVPGHVQQGGTPSPMDRVRAVRLAIRSMEFLEENHSKTKKEILDDPDTAAVIGIRGANVVLTGIQELADNETDWENRRPLQGYWKDFKEVVDLLSGSARPVD